MDEKYFGEKLKQVACSEDDNDLRLSRRLSAHSHSLEIGSEYGCNLVALLKTVLTSTASKRKAIRRKAAPMYVVVRGMTERVQW